MRTNKFTTQKLFCTLLFNLLVMGAFAQFTPNAAGAPDEPIPEPEVEGASCETAYQLNLDEDNFYTAEEEQEIIYFVFTATNDSMAVLFNEIANTAFSQASIYELNGCENQDFHQEQDFNEEDAYNYIHFFDLEVNQNYLIEISRNSDELESQLDFQAQLQLLDVVRDPCPVFQPQCGELISNGGFNYVDNLSLFNFNNGESSSAFKNGHLCGWSGDESPDLYQRHGKTYARMIHYDSTMASYNNTFRESINMYQNIDAGDYIFSVELAASHDTIYSIPQELQLILVDTLNNLDTVIAKISGSQIQRRSSSSDINFPTKTACFQVSGNYHQIKVSPLVDIQTDKITSIYIDNVSLRNAGAGEDIEISNICSYPLIDLGADSSCSIPGADYLWLPYEPHIVSGNPYTANIKVYPYETETYTLTISNLPGNNCILTDEVTIKLPYDHYLYNADVLDLFTKVGDSSGYISNRIFRIEGTLTLDTSMYFANCSFYMGEDAKIVVNNNASVVFYNNRSNIKEEFFTSCSPDKYWDGIYQTNGSDFLMWGNDTINNNTDTIAWRINNSKNGINLIDVEDVKIEEVHFEGNGKALTIKNTGANTTNANINQLIIQCTQPLNYGNGEFYPQTAIDLKNIRTRPSGLYSNQFDIQNIVLNGSGGNIHLTNSEATIDSVSFSGFNNYYQSPGEPDKSDKVIVAYGGDANAKLKIRYSSFVGNRESIRVQDQYSVEVSNNYVNSAGIPDASFLRVSDVINLSTIQGYNLNQISNNTILNVKKGVELYNSHYFYISNNYFDMEVQPDSNYYTKNNNEESVAIYANGYSENPYVVSHQSLIENNVIAHSKVGIQVSMMWSSIKDNNIKNLNNRFTAPSFCFPIQSPCPTTPSYGIRAMNSKVYIEGNTVENELNQYSGTMPNTQKEMVGISLENLNSVGGNNLSLYCNKTENTGIGLRFAGYNGFCFIYNNRMVNNNIGFALDNEAYIGDVGASLLVSGQEQDAANEWVGFSLNNPHTFNFSNDDPNNPPTHYVLSGTGPTIDPSDRNPGYFAMTTTTTSNTNSISCTAPLMVDNSSDKKEATTAYNKSGKNPRWMQKKNASDSAFYLRQQLQFYHLSKDSALYNSQQFSSFRDSMKNTALGRALGKNSQAMRSLSAQNNFDQNVSTIEPLLDKHFVDSTLSSSELDQLRQIAVLCPYTDGIAVYQARRVLHEYGERLYVNECEISQFPNNQKFIRIKAEEKQEKVPFTLYPNPADEQLNISYSVEEDEEIVLEIYDVLGKKIMTKSLNSGHLHQINTSQLQHGVYIYRLFKSKEQINSGKLVIE